MERNEFLKLLRSIYHVYLSRSLQINVLGPEFFTVSLKSIIQFSLYRFSRSIVEM